jgi:hypothetical protein
VKGEIPAPPRDYRLRDQASRLDDTRRLLTAAIGKKHRTMGTTNNMLDDSLFTWDGVLIIGSCPGKGEAASMTILPLRRVLAILGCATVLGLGAPAAAQAQTAAPTNQLQQHAANTAASCSTLWVHFGGGYGWVCVLGSITYPNGAYPVDVIQPVNSHRIWFHELSNGGGWSRCFWGASDTIYIPSQYQYPGNILISGNTARC